MSLLRLRQLSTEGAPNDKMLQVVDGKWALVDPPAGGGGVPGADGASAYEVAVANGFVGDEAAWLASLVGPEGDPGAPGEPGAPGDPGDDGLSAYQVAVNNGFVGTEAEWLASLQGEPGEPGGGGGAGGTTVATVAPAEVDRYDGMLWTNPEEAWPVPTEGGGGFVDVTDTPLDPPYSGYAYLTSDGKLRIWTGTGWRQIVTTEYVPPLVGDAAIMLPSLVGRYVANELAYADGDPVEAWPDVSGLGNDLLVTTAGTMETAGIGGLKSVVFTDSTLYQLPTAVPRPVTVIGVMQNNDGSNGSILFSSPVGGGTYEYVGLLAGAGARISDGGSTYVDYAAPAASIGEPHVIYGQVQVGGPMLVGADGGRSSSPSSVALNVKNLGQWWASTAYSMSGLVSEMLVYNEILTESQIDAIVHRLGEVYGITVSV